MGFNSCPYCGWNRDPFIDDYCKESASCKAEYNDFEDCEIWIEHEKRLREIWLEKQTEADRKKWLKANCDRKRR